MTQTSPHAPITTPEGLELHTPDAAWTLAVTRDQELAFKLRHVQLPGLGATPGTGWEVGQEC